MVALMSLLLACSTPSTPDAPAPAPDGQELQAPDDEPMARRVEITEARVRAMPPGAPNSGAFMTLRNQGGSDARLIGGTSQAAASVELHTHVMDDGMMQMRAIPEIVVPAGGEVVLEPGGLHVMLLGLTGPLEVGQTVPISLQYGDGSWRVVQVPVVAIQGHGDGPGHGKAKAP